MKIDKKTVEYIARLARLALTEKEKEESISNIRSLGFKVTYSERLMQKNGYFSATDEERAADLNEMFEREDVKGIICVTIESS